MLNNNHIFKFIASGLYAFSIILTFNANVAEAAQTIQANNIVAVQAWNDTPPYGK